MNQPLIKTRKPLCPVNFFFVLTMPDLGLYAKQGTKPPVQSFH